MSHPPSRAAGDDVAVRDEPAPRAKSYFFPDGSFETSRRDTVSPSSW